MTLKQEIDKWLKDHPDATPEQAIWEGTCIEMRLWINKTKE